MESQMDLSDRTVLVTGAAGNLGRAVARAFGARGATLILLDRSQDLLATAFGAANDRRLFAPADLLDAASTRAAVDAAVQRLGRIDVLANLAGGFRMGEAVHETSDDTWRFLFDVNVRTLMNAVRAVVPHMIARRGGKIVNVGAFSAQRGLAQMGAYCAAKGTVIRLTEAMAAELREQGINVNCVLPTTLDTPENRLAMPDADPAQWVALDDLARAIVYLASPEADGVHGAALPVTGLA